MGRQMPWDDIPDSNVFPTGFYHVVGVKLEEVMSSAGKLMFASEVEIVDHPATNPYTGMHIFNNFVIGSDDDPEAQVAGTWAQGFGKSYKQMIAAAQIAEQHDTEKQCASFAGTQFVWGLKVSVQAETNRDGSANQFAGNEQNNPTRFYKIGEKEPQIAPKKAVPGAAPVKAVVAPTAPPLATGTGPVAGVVAPPAAPIQPVAPVAPAAPAPLPGQPVPVTPVAPVAVAPPVVAAPVPPVAPAPVAPASTGQVLPCNICGRKDVPSLEFADHIQACLIAQAGK